MRTEIKKVYVDQNVYIADDGTEFTNKRECEYYEKHKMELQKAWEKVKDLTALGDYPPCDGGDNSQHRYYRWFKISNQRELDLLTIACGDGSIYEVKRFPEFICVESEDPARFTDGYWTYLSQCKEYVRELFEGLGFSVAIAEKPISKPLPQEVIDFAEETGKSIHGVLKLMLNELIYKDIDAFNNMVSEKLTGDPNLLEDISYQTVGATDDGDALIFVSGIIQKSTF